MQQAVFSLSCVIFSAEASKPGTRTYANTCRHLSAINVWPTVGVVLHAYGLLSALTFGTPHSPWCLYILRNMLGMSHAHTHVHYLTHTVTHAQYAGSSWQHNWSFTHPHTPRHNTNNNYHYSYWKQQSQLTHNQQVHSLWCKINLSVFHVAQTFHQRHMPTHYAHARAPHDHHTRVI